MNPPDVLLAWPDVVLDLQDMLMDVDTPVYIVGGAVRDALLRRPVKDIDMATPESGIRLAKLIANRLKGDFFPLDEERDVGRALVDTPEGRLVIDVARFRGTDLEADLRARDFTINAMAVDARADLNRVIDPLNGVSDAIQKVLRRCNPEAMASDPIRALRAVRQSAQLNLRIEAETLRDVRATVPRLTEISPERVRDEFIRLMALPKPSTGLRVAATVGLLGIIVPEADALRGAQGRGAHADGWLYTLAIIDSLTNIIASISYTRNDNTASQFSMGTMVVALDRFRKQINDLMNNTWPDERPHRALLMLAALLHTTSPALVEERAVALRLSNGERARLAGVVEHYHAVLAMEAATPRAIYRFWRAAGDAGTEASLLAMAVMLGEAMGGTLDQDGWVRLVERVQLLLDARYQQYERLIDPPALLDGNALMSALGVRPGPIVGELVELIREAQAVGEVRNADEALALARGYMERKT